jgi:hypothetical protein
MKNTIHIPIIVLFIGILSACATVGTPTSTPDTTVANPPDTSPPPATLTINGATQTAGVGTYCWSTTTAPSESVQACVDKIGVPTARDPLTSTSPVMGLLTLPLNDPPTQAVLSVFPASDINEIKLPDDTGENRWWNFIEGFTSILSQQTSQEIKQELQPGLYVFYVFVIWEGKGDVSYGFLVEVK